MYLSVYSAFPRFKIEFYLWWHAERKVCQSVHGRRAETEYLMSHFKYFSRCVLFSISKCVKSVKRFNGMRSFGVNSTKKKRPWTLQGMVVQSYKYKHERECWSGNCTTCLLNYQTGKWLWPWRRKLWGTGPRPSLTSRIQSMCDK